ncbi:hypothetical protein EX30DRAFT_373612 [Ascodesmis nigricans]|uniref:Uncharacterized protein n=1 Tax=Ascodesmis nigricans TaxID=341454 RepID=A0A4S2MNR2_9PEZI|nr:hypothetical protein EX30DRAFT_373612 [Ascodesmis nigricans]
MPRGSKHQSGGGSGAGSGMEDTSRRMEQYHSTVPITHDLATGMETWPTGAGAGAGGASKQALTTCPCRGNAGACSCAPNTCACPGCGNKSRENPTRVRGPEHNKGAWVKDVEMGGESMMKGEKMGTMGQEGGGKIGEGMKHKEGCRRMGRGECDCMPGECRQMGQ